MSLAILIDMNLSVEWVDFLRQHGHDAVHWSQCGDPTAEDSTLMAWALSQRRIVFTHDLDFGTMLALTHAAGPSVIQIRGAQIFPEHLGLMLATVLTKYETELLTGALIVIEPGKSRVRVLPI